ncbi:XRCC1 protein, partial [Leptocoma aspasia]|nr:XRCC1 protein [Leptocoma aspasia]
GVVLALSGFQNPLRAHLREAAAALGARYRPDWTPECTHLVHTWAHLRHTWGAPGHTWTHLHTPVAHLGDLHTSTCAPPPPPRYLLDGPASSGSEGEEPEDAPPPSPPSP